MDDLLDFLNTDATRWTLVALSMLVVIALIVDAIVRWESLPKRFQRTTPWIIATYVVLAYGLGEVAYSRTELPLGLRLLLLAVVLVGLLAALVASVTHDD